MQKIVFKNKEGSVGIIHPTQEAINVFGIEAIAKKDVPAPYEYVSEWKEEDINGELIDVPAKYETYYTPYWIVDDSVIPEDRTFRNAWRVDSSFGAPQGFGGESDEFDADILQKYLGVLNGSSN